MDDLILIADRETLVQAKAGVSERLAAMGLQIKGDGGLNRAALGVPFLGFTVYPDRVRLDRRGRRRLGRNCVPSKLAPAATWMKPSGPRGRTRSLLTPGGRTMSRGGGRSVVEPGTAGLNVGTR